MNKKGFTLIELLVVVSIISFIASLITTSFAVSKQKTRDAVRVRTLQEIEKAILLYAADNNGALPTTASYGESDSGGWDYSTEGYGFIQFLTGGGYIKEVKDPLGGGTGDVFDTGTGYAYGYRCDRTPTPACAGQTYTLGAVLERPNDYKVQKVFYVSLCEKGFTCQ